MTVGTHRHGCCVLQRCIDHASGVQKGNLIAAIISNAFSLVQDPFGNYVLQYIVDLGEPAFTTPLCESFHGSIPLLSKQKFSSNVIEKCIRGAETHVASMMIGEMLQANELEKMLRDSFANYVIQTALDYADPDMREQLVDTIRPILPSIRQTPYGRRIQSKIVAHDSRGRHSGMGTPVDPTNPGQIAMSRQSSGGNKMYGGAPGANGAYTAQMNGGYQGNGGMNAYLPTTFGGHNASSYSNAPTGMAHYAPDHQTPMHQPTPAYGRQGMNGFNYF